MESFWDCNRRESSLRRFIQVNFDVFGGAPGGDNVEAAIAIQVGQAKILAGHSIVIQNCLCPIRAFLIRWREQFDADFSIIVFSAPANDYLVEACFQQIATSERVPFFKGGI